MGELQSISGEIIRVSVGIIGLMLLVGVGVAALEAQINNLMGRPTSNAYSGKLLLFVLVLGIAAIAVPISKTMAQVFGH